ncbi:MAG: hypothetical protein ACYTGH_05845 [Planctomycetota bacterium]|jgi:hypothetical protein
MPISFHYDRTPRIIHTVVTGCCDAADLHDYLGLVRVNQEVEAGFIEILDLEGAERLRINFAACNDLLSNYRKLQLDQGYAGSVIYAPKDLQYGIARMLATTFDRHLPVHVTRSRAEVGAGILQIRNRGEEAGVEALGNT